jgi:DNA-binding MarR family transcriptional regulator
MTMARRKEHPEVGELAQASGDRAGHLQTAHHLHEHPLADHIGYALRRAQVAVFQDFCESTAQFDLRPAEYSVLVILKDKPDMRHNHLARMLAIKPANCVILINNLEERGLVTREKLPVSGRAIVLKLTRRGETLLHQANKKVEEHRQRMRDRLGEEGAAHLLQLLNRLFEG